MAGHGGPPASRSRGVFSGDFARKTACRAAVCWLLTAAWLCAQETELADLRLRLEWGGGTPRAWDMEAWLEDGTISRPVSLGIEANVPGSAWIQQRALRLRQASPRNYEGVDISVEGPLSSTLYVTLASRDGAVERHIPLPLEQFATGPRSVALDEDNNRLVARRVPGDELRFTTNRDTLVFHPGELFEFTVVPNLIPLSENGELTLRAELLAAGERRVRQSESVPYSVGEDALPTDAEMQASWTMPDDEGVFVLRLSLQQKTRFYAPVKTLSEREIQLVVASNEVTARGAPSAEFSQIVQEITPTDILGSPRIPRLSLLQSARRVPLHHGDVALNVHASLGSLVRLGPAATPAERTWAACPLEIERPGTPHIVEIEFPSDERMFLGVSLVEPNSAGVVEPIGLDSGVYRAEAVEDEPATMQRHRLVIWPKSETPWLLLTNLQPNASADFGVVRVRAAQKGQVTQVPLPQMSLIGSETPPASLPPAFDQPRTGDARLWAAYFDRPLLPENFSSPEQFDPWSRRSLDDWGTFYQAGRRLVQYLDYAGYNALMLSVYNDGSAIYPSDLLAATPRYDTGIFLSKGADPQRKDVLELLFRLCDQRQIQLVPALNFRAPLPALEEEARSEPEGASGIWCVGRQGTARDAAGRGRYNILDPRVQRAVRDVLAELAERYAAHPMFHGVSLQLSADGFLQLPGGEWGLDDQTFARFERDTGLECDARGPQRFAQRADFALEHRARWLAWRARELSRFFRELREEIATHRPGAKLYLAGSELFDSPELQQKLQPALLESNNLQDLLWELGIDLEHFVEDDAIVFLRPRKELPPLALDGQAANLLINQASDFERHLGSGPFPGSLFFHEPRQLYLESFDLHGPFEKSHTVLYTQASPAGWENRRRYVRSLAHADQQAFFDGGWLLPMGQEASLADLMLTFQQLPRERFEDVATGARGTTLRTLRRDGVTYAYVVNDAPWPVHVTASFQGPLECEAQALGSGQRPVDLSRGRAGQWVWNIPLEPFDLFAVRLSSENIRFTETRSQVPSEIQNQLDRQVRELSVRARALVTNRPLGILRNPDFELPIESGTLPGWSIERGPTAQNQEFTASIKYDRAARQGGQSLHMHSGGTSLALLSEAFAPPPSGRVMLSVWLRTYDVDAQPDFKLRVESAEENGPRYEAFAAVGQGRHPLGTDWREYRLPVSDLPQGADARLRVRFELNGPGDVWLDEVRLFDPPFSETKRARLLMMIHGAELDLDQGNIGEFARFMDSYWPRYLVENIPLAEPPSAVEPPYAPPPAARAAQRPERQPGMLDRVKNLVPRFWR